MQASVTGVAKGLPRANYRIQTPRCWLLARDTMGVREYWTGVCKHGEPRRTLWKSDAMHFSSARACYEAAATHGGLHDSDEWRAVPR